jgi:hypothetical protein
MNELHEHEISEETETHTFPATRLGIQTCTRPECASDQLLLCYDELSNEYIVCIKCNRMKQQLRIYDAEKDTFIEQITEPQIRDDEYQHHDEED